jgi:predicted DNA-binding WGR domain protein
MAMTSLCIRLEARSPAHRCFRAYEVAAGVDLFGAWLVEMTYGRIGTSGRTKTRSFPIAEGPSAGDGLPAETRERATPDWRGVSCAQCGPERRMVRARLG